MPTVTETADVEALLQSSRNLRVAANRAAQEARAADQRLVDGVLSLEGKRIFVRGYAFERVVRGISKPCSVRFAHVVMTVTEALSTTGSGKQFEVSLRATTIKGEVYGFHLSPDLSIQVALDRH